MPLDEPPPYKFVFRQRYELMLTRLTILLQTVRRAVPVLSETSTERYLQNKTWLANDLHVHQDHLSASNKGPENRLLEFYQFLMARIRSVLRMNNILRTDYSNGYMLGALAHISAKNVRKYFGSKVAYREVL